jgi:hypothetical protein
MLVGYFLLATVAHLSSRAVSGCCCAATVILVKNSVSALVESIAYPCSSASMAHLKSLRKRQALLLRS